MKLIENGFQPYYYLTEGGKVYNSKTKRYLEGNNGSVKLLLEDGHKQSISIKKLYKMVYGKEVVEDNIVRLPGEVFLPIPGAEEKYHCSNMGRVLSYANKKAQLLNPTLQDGYPRIYISVYGAYKNLLVHKIVADLFCEVPEGKKKEELQIHHKNFIRTDGRAENLVYLTPGEHYAIHAKHIEEQAKCQDTKQSQISEQ